MSPRCPFGFPEPVGFPRCRSGVPHPLWLPHCLFQPPGGTIPAPGLPYHICFRCTRPASACRSRLPLRRLSGTSDRPVPGFPQFRSRSCIIAPDYTFRPYFPSPPAAACSQTPNRGFPPFRFPAGSRCPNAGCPAHLSFPLLFYTIEMPAPDFPPSRILSDNRSRGLP